MDLGLAGPVAIVGGSSSGMGRATARTLAGEGCRVVLFARRAELLNGVAAAITAEALAVPTDATNPVNLTGSSVKEPKTISREEARHGITVNSIAPGSIATDRLVELYANEPDPAAAKRRDEGLIPAGRFGDPEEIAAAVAFLCSTGAAYITGTTLLVDGGLAQGLLS